MVILTCDSKTIWLWDILSFNIRCWVYQFMMESVGKKEPPNTCCLLPSCSIQIKEITVGWKERAKTISYMVVTANDGTMNYFPPRAKQIWIANYVSTPS